jgi:hypothetical protein
MIFPIFKPVSKRKRRLNDSGPVQRQTAQAGRKWPGSAQRAAQPTREAAARRGGLRVARPGGVRHTRARPNEAARGPRGRQPAREGGRPSRWRGGPRGKPTRARPKARARLARSPRRPMARRERGLPDGSRWRRVAAGGGALAGGVHGSPLPTRFGHTRGSPRRARPGGGLHDPRRQPGLAGDERLLGSGGDGAASWEEGWRKEYGCAGMLTGGVASKVRRWKGRGSCRTGRIVDEGGRSRGRRHAGARIRAGVSNAEVL